MSQHHGGHNPPPPPPAPSSDLPAHTVQIHDTFDGNFGHFTNRWGDVHLITVNGDGGLQVTSPISTHADAGAMFPTGTGPGYGLYEFTLVANTTSAPGPFADLWPGNNQWPGPELDLIEQQPGGQTYSTVHYRDSSGGDGNLYVMGPGAAHLTDVHTWAMDWERGSITYFLDGHRYGQQTSHVPLDAAHGGMNEDPGVGEQTWWSAAQQTGDNSFTLLDFKYSVIA